MNVLRYFSCLVVLLGCFSCVTSAKRASTTRPLACFGTSSASSLPQRFKLLNWNVEKGREPSFAAEFGKLSAGAELVALQEMSTRSDSKNGPSPVHALLKRTGIAYQMVEVLEYEHGFAGVATGCTARPLEAIPLRSPSDEPIIKLLKSSLVTRYRLQGRTDTLMLANTHGMNLAGKAWFGLGRFDQQMKAVGDVLAGHQGPLIWAGDFNTHSAGKTQALQRLTDHLGLQRVSIANAKRLMHSHAGLELDHVYVRGLKVISATALSSDGSDHTPMILELTLP